MTREALIKINVSGMAVEIPSPEDFNVEQKEICRMERTASGKMVKDVVAVKKEIVLKYIALEKNYFVVLRTLYQEGNAIDIEYNESGVTFRKRMYITSLPRKIVVYDTDFVRDVDVRLEEV